MESATVRNETESTRAKRMVPYDGSEPFIFISYAHRDSAQVHPFIARLMEDGYRVWYDAGIDPGTEWDSNIADHIERCGYFLALISENYLRSENCKDELNFVRDLGKQRLLVFLQDVTLPAGMRMRLSRLQAIYKYTYSSQQDFYERVYAAQGIESTLCKAAPKEPVPEPAVQPEPIVEAVEPEPTVEAAEPEPVVEADGDAACAETEEIPSAEVCAETQAAAQSEVCAEAEEVKPTEICAPEPEEEENAPAETAEPPVDEKRDEAAAYFEKGNDSFAKRDYYAAVAWYYRAADLGHAGACYNLAVCHWEGKGVHKSAIIAARLYRQSAEQGNAQAQYAIAQCYQDGIGVEKDGKIAMQWYQKAAEQGHMKAQYCLGQACLEFQNRNYLEAVKWLTKAAEQGDADAQFCLAECYRYSRGVRFSPAVMEEWYRKAADRGHKEARAYLFRCTPATAKTMEWYRENAEKGDVSAQLKMGKDCFGRRDYANALKWYLLAGKNGSEEAMVWLGECYENGIITVQHLETAAKWYELAADAGNKEAKKRLLGLKWKRITKKPWSI